MYYNGDDGKEKQITYYVNLR